MANEYYGQLAYLNDEGHWIIDRFVRAHETRDFKGVHVIEKEAFDKLLLVARGMEEALKQGCSCEFDEGGFPFVRCGNCNARDHFHKTLKEMGLGEKEEP